MNIHYPHNALQHYRPVVALWCGLTLFLGVWHNGITAQETAPAGIEKEAVLTLNQCINIALENNLQIRQTSLNIDASQIELFRSKMDMLPSLNADVSHGYNFGRSIDPTTNLFVLRTIQFNSASLNSNAVLFDGFRKINTIRENEYNLKASEAEVEQVMNEITLSVLNSYLSILLAYEEVNISRNQLEISKRQEERVAAQVAVGNSPEGELLDVQAQVANDELSLTNAENQLEMAYVDMALLLEWDITDAFRIDKPDIEPATLPEVGARSMDDIYQNALDYFPSVREAEHRLMGAEMGMKVASSGHIPTLSIFGSVTTNYSSGFEEPTDFVLTGMDTIGVVQNTENVVVSPTFDVIHEPVPFWQQISQNLSQGVGLSLTIPLFRGWQTHTSQERARINHLSAKYSLDQARNQLRKDVQQSYANARSARKQYEAAKKNVNATERSFEYAEQRFQAGALNALEFNNIQNRLANARSELVRAKYDYIFRLKILDFYQGQPLTLEE